MVTRYCLINILILKTTGHWSDILNIYQILKTENNLRGCIYNVIIINMHNFKTLSVRIFVLKYFSILFAYINRKTYFFCYKKLF